MSAMVSQITGNSIVLQQPNWVSTKENIKACVIGFAREIFPSQGAMTCVSMTWRHHVVTINADQRCTYWAMTWRKVFARYRKCTVLYFITLKRKVVILMTFLLLSAPKVVIWQLSVQTMSKISTKWKHFLLSQWPWDIAIALYSCMSCLHCTAPNLTPCESLPRHRTNIT